MNDEDMEKRVAELEGAVVFAQGLADAFVAGSKPKTIGGFDD